MSNWTDSARKALERYFDAIRPSLTATGADPDEVIDDLRQHLEREIAATALKVVTEQDVQRLLARIGAPPVPELAGANTSATSTANPAEQGKPRSGGFWRGLLLLLGVLVPAATLVIEGATGMCAAAFFDPLPTWWHAVLVAFVPVGNGLLWLAWRRQLPAWANRLGWINGAVVGVSAYYTVIYIPLLLPGLLAIIWFGFGLLPLAPVLALASACVMRRSYRREVLGAAARLRGFWPGLALGLLALLAVESGNIATRVGLNLAASEIAEEQLPGIRLLRGFGDRDRLLRACYGYTRGAAQMDFWAWVIPGSTRVQPEKARAIYFRVTGRAFNLEPAPRLRTARGAWAEVNEWTWDGDHGGDKVGGRIKGLDLHSSRLDVVTDPAAAWSYSEWTMEFRNESLREREARAQVLLPPGGVVSRLTLWVNGEEREAAFAGRSLTKEAYRQVAVRQRKDPVLVTTSGPDRVMMQCFPVPANGGVMKIRMGVTAPLVLDNIERGTLRLPCFLERNFTIRKGFTHALWAQSPGLLSGGNPALAPEISTNGAATLRGSLNDTELSSPAALLTVHRKTPARVAWAKDTLGGGQFIRQTIVEEPVSPPSRVAFVIDGSAGMKPHWDAILKAISALPAGQDVAVLVAHEAEDGGEPVVRFDRSAGAAGWARIQPVGGQDDVPALRRAWEHAASQRGAVVVWIHGPQPMLMDSVEPLMQLIERSPRGPTLYELQTEPGPDQVLDQLEGLTLAPVMRRGSVESDLVGLVNVLQSSTNRLVLRRELAASEGEAKRGEALATSQHLARLWAADEVKRLRSERKADKAAALAAAHQLVTPVSGAVVLESQAQYRQTGLQPVDPQTVPTIPEPSTLWLVLSGALLLVGWRARRRRPVNCG
jgi:hypothetical protein